MLQSYDAPPIFFSDASNGGAGRNELNASRSEKQIGHKPLPAAVMSLKIVIFKGC